MSAFSAMNLLDRHDIVIRNPHLGENRADCPECQRHGHHGRGNLAVSIEPGGKATWLCHRCGWKGGIGANGDEWPKPRAGDFEPVMPAPREPTAAELRNREFGDPSNVWKYTDADGNLLFVQRRFDLQDGRKEYRPRTYGRRNGHFAWQEKAPPAPRPLYALHRLAMDAHLPVLVVEGEKAADAAGLLFPDCVPVSPMNGAKAPGKTDWSPLAGRDVMVWPDADEAGRKFAEAVAELAADAGANAIRIVQFPDDAPSKWDLADPVPDGWNLGEMLDEAKPWAAAPPTFDEIVAELAELQPHEYDRVRKAKAVELNVRVSTLDDAVEAARIGTDSFAGGGTAKGSCLNLPEIEPWAEPVNGAALLGEIDAQLRRYISFQNEFQARAISLWCVHAHTMDFAEVAPRLVINSPTPGCGKSVLLGIAGRLVPRALLASNVSPAATFRVMEAASPTLLIDEADTFVGRDSDELRGILNSGHTRNSAFVVRAVEVDGDYEARRFSTWGAMALAGIGKLPGTIMSRAIAIEMQRAQAAEKPERYVARKAGHLDVLVRKVARWVQDNRHRLEDADPDVPEALANRSYDNWVELIAIADAAGGDWSRFARETALKLNAPTDDEARAILLLSHVREVFGDRDKMSSDAIVEGLTNREEWPWCDVRGKPLTKNRLATMLKPFKIQPGTIRLDSGKTPKGYPRSALAAAWNRYLPPLSYAGANQTATTPHARESAASSDFQNATPESDVAFWNRPEPSDSAGCGGVAFQNGVAEGKEEDDGEEDVL